MIAGVRQKMGCVKDCFARAAINVTVSGARRLPAFRDGVLNRLSATLGRSYQENVPDPQLLAFHLWFGRKLRPFLCRLLEERPRAARKLIHLAYVWANDVKRRSHLSAPGIVTPVTFVIEPTGRCNLRCPQCYANSTPEGSDLPYEVWKRAVAEAREMGVTLVTLTGGEPFLREAKDRIISRLAADFPNMGFLVYTNATMIDEDAAARLEEVGNVFPGISVEGYERETDGRRGDGYTRKATRVREILAKHEVLYGFSATVTRRNADLLSADEFIARRLEEGDMFGWYFLLQPIGRSPDASMLVMPEQRAKLRDQVYKWRDEGKPIFLGDFWNDGCLVGGCIAGGRYYFHIYANGDISPCVFAPIACGNVLDVFNGKSEYRSLADFVNRHPFFAKFREKQQEVTDYRAPCLLMDHPEKLREICAQAPWYPANNMPEGYLDGGIARALDSCSKDWEEALRGMPLVPERVQRDIAAARTPKTWRDRLLHLRRPGSGPRRTEAA